MKIAAWNVNSVRARLDHLARWITAFQPDVVLLQELKCADDAFPHLEVQALGYQAAVHGQKSYNGVAILTRTPPVAVRPGLPGFSDDQARYLEADLANGLTVASVYVPNGMDLASAKFTYKLDFYAALARHLAHVRQQEIPYLLGGDFNVCRDDADVYDPDKWRGRIHFSLPERRALRTLLHVGFSDSFRTFNPHARQYSWWDYREGRFDRDEGLRIDYLLASPQAMDRVQTAGIDSSPRSWDKPSDHVPVWVTVQDLPVAYCSLAKG
jgi:exodeoxyribonuclease III